MGVGRGDDRDAGLDRQPDLGAGQVEPVGEAVRLEGDAGLEGDLEDRLEVERVRRPVVDDPPFGWLRHETAGWRMASVTFRVRASRLALPGVEAQLHPVELGEDVVGQVEAPVAADVDLGPAEDAEGRELLVGERDLLALAP